MASAPYDVHVIIETVEWIVELSEEFDPEFDALHEDVQNEILALSRLLQQFGPELGRPRRRYAQGLAARKDEGTPIQSGGWRMARSVRFRYEA
jgi:hypothetical protein